MIIIIKGVSSMHYLKVLKNTLFCGLLMVVSLFVNESFKQICLILAIGIGSYKQTYDGIVDSIKNKRINVELLMIISALGAVFIGEPFEGAALIFIFSLSGELETLTSDKSQKEIRKLMTNQPQTAKLIIEGEIKVVSLESLKKGDIVTVSKGELISADGVIIQGSSDIDESMITGESMPVSKGVKSNVYTGTLNLSGPLNIRVLETSDNAMIQKIIKMVENSEKQQSKTALFINKIEGIYALLVLVVVSLVFIYFRFWLQWNFDKAMYRSIILLVVASPCALIASVTPATLAGIAKMARQGVLIKGGSYLETLNQVDAMAFDKTGTLTLGKPSVVQDVFIEPVQEIVSLMESKSTHPLALAISSHYDTNEIYEFKEFKDINGVGLSAIYNEVHYKVGKYEHGNYHVDILKAYEAYKNDGLSIVAVYRNHDCVGLIGLRDTIRQESYNFINDLKALHITPIMITGDQEVSAMKIAHELGIERVEANCLPEDKVRVLNELNQEFNGVMMVGDGINDAPALAVAGIGVSIGSGSDIAIESSDIVLMNSSLSNIVDALKTSKKLSKIIIQNIVFSLSVIVCLILCNLLGIINLPLGVLGHEGSTILVILNGLRMLKSK